MVTPIRNVGIGVALAIARLAEVADGQRIAVIPVVATEKFDN